MFVRDFSLRDPQAFQALLSWCPLAVVSFVASEQIGLLKPILDSDIPVVNASRSQPSEKMAVVLGDAEEFYTSVTRIFHDNHIDHICQVAMGEVRGPFSTQHRYKQFALKHNLPYKSYWLKEPDSLKDLHLMETVDPEFADWLKRVRKPVGLFSQNHMTGCYIARACELLGIQVPEEVQIVGCDGFEVSTSTRPTVTSLRARGEKVGARAAEMALEMAENNTVYNEVVLVGGFITIQRGSTGSEQSDECNVDEALRFIHTHACNPVTVQDVIDHTQKVSRVTFHKHFVASTGKTPAKAILERRMEEARWLLTQTDISPGVIAGLCGYDDYVHFYRVFRKAQGVSPSDYRKLSS
ncbi:helix-turn-helix domain-containing protein [Aeoliella mucimassa]|nr:helix-turn-helix domain-containing protein [Aeoliella mucimassa]